MTGWRTFRIRDYFYANMADDPELLRLAHESRDRLGWFPAPLVSEVLRRASATIGCGPNPTAVLFENFPGSAEQVTQLLENWAPPPVALVLKAPLRVLAARAESRRVCRSCDEDPLGEPHQPAAALPPGLCAVCGSVLSRRLQDRHEVFAERVRRFRTRWPTVREALISAGTVVRSLDSRGTTDDVRTQAITALESLCGALRGV
jgi:adenylate kinase family enzyme